MTTWTGSCNSSLPLSYQKCPDHAVCGRVLRESRGASRFGASAGTAVTVLYPAARARKALAKAGSSLTVTIMASTIARVAADRCGGRLAWDLDYGEPEQSICYA